MESASSPRIECPRCGLRYPWREAFAGKQVKCRCGEAFVACPPGDGQDGSSAPASPPASRRKLSGFYTEMSKKHTSVSQALADRVDEVKRPRFTEVYLPAAILSVGAMTALILCLRFTDSFLEGIASEAAALGFQVFVFLPVLAVCTMLVAQWFDLGLGTLWSGLWKMAALTLGPAAISDVLFVATLVITEFDWETLVAGFGYYVILCIAPLCIMFALSLYEGALLVAMMFVTRVAVLYTAAALWPECFK